MVHAIVQLSITNPQSFKAYREKASAALTRHDAKVVQSSRDLSTLDGTIDLPEVSVILSFDSKDKAQAWINDPELAETHDLRRNAGNCNIMLMG